MEVTKEELLERLRRAEPRGCETLLVAIDGLGGAGKTSLAGWLAAELSAQVVSVDDFGAPRRPIDEWDWGRLREQVLQPLLLDRPSRYQRYDWDADTLAEWRDVLVGGVLIVEGVSVLRTELADPWDVTIWVDCSREIRLERGIARSGEAIRDTWVNEWMPAEDRYAAEQQPRERADFIVAGT